MSKRNDRRDAERLARKDAYQELRQSRAAAAQAPEPQSDLGLVESTDRFDSPVESVERAAAAPQSDLLAQAQAFFPQPEPAAAPTPTISESQLAANRANSLLSTGPTTLEGKAVSARNALKHGLTGKAVVLPTEDAAEYDNDMNNFIRDLAPATEEELRQVTIMVDSLWRTTRMRRIETGILRKGYQEFESKYKDSIPVERLCFPEVDAYLKYEKSIRNLHIQEARLQRMLQKAQAELSRLQTIRRREELAALQAVRQVPRSASANGFVFSSPESQPLSSSAGALSFNPNTARRATRSCLFAETFQNRTFNSLIRSTCRDAQSLL